MEKIRVNIREFQDKYIKGALIPEDIMAYFTECFLKGQDYADIRATVYEEMKIREFYNKYPELRPQTDWEVIALYSFLTDLMASVIKNESQTCEKAQELIRRTGLIIDSYKVKNRNTAELEYIYETALWLKSEIIK